MDFIFGEVEDERLIPAGGFYGVQLFRTGIDFLFDQVRDEMFVGR